MEAFASSEQVAEMAAVSYSESYLPAVQQDSPGDGSC